jgi:1-acyl-sn-glycerol-3-phosphate acyltransferase
MLLSAARFTPGTKMAQHSQFTLLSQRRFLPFFLTQALGAFNDNVFKNALVILIINAGFTAAERSGYTNLAAGLFILPVFLFSATSGQLADKYDKARLAQLVKMLEVAIMLVASLAFIRHDIRLLLAMLFMMGLHSTVFGPLKYGILPQVLKNDELVGGNGLIEMGTFVAILIGTILGSVLIQSGANGPLLASLACVTFAVVGLGCSMFIPKTASVAPDLKIDWNPFTETWNNVKHLRANRTVFLSCLGISWFWFFGSTFLTQLPVYAVDVLGGSSSVYTLLLTLFTVGAGIGSLLCERLSGHKVEIGLVPFGSIGMTVFGIDLYFAHPDAATVVGVGWREFIQLPGSWRLLADLVLMAVFSGFFIVPLFALIQSRTEPARRSRVIAANNILNALFMVVAAGLAVVLLNVAHLTIPQLLLVTAILNAFVAIYIYTLVPEFLMRFLSWIFINTLYRMDVRGLEKIPEEGPALVVCNHVSFMDGMLIGGSVRRPIRFVMYYKIFQIPVLSFLFRAARAIPIAGKKEDPAMMERAFDEVDRELAEGHLVAIFPEGGITRDGEIDRFRPGVERILARRPVPVVPMALRGMWGSMFSRKAGSTLGRIVPRRFLARIGLAISDPIAPGEATAEVLEQRVRELRGDWA